ncbi:MAG: (E)-4-hydroxy-3-methylbut-2-enyl-diphosphate synthase [Paraglaciecola sp.]|jgi:(E)-4-hydroxy-3-methylbut-2-enyl-diphosphate synthase
MNKKTFSAPVSYTASLTKYQRRKTRVVNIGGIPMGGDHPIRVQSMTTVDTMDTAGSVEQCIRMIEAGCEYIRITAPSIKEAQNLKEIKDELRRRGYNAPLIADIHFTPNAAELAAKIVEKVRVNPGNYADKKKFEEIEYDDVSYQAELDRIRVKFTPLVNICKEYGTAMRIGTNHGSLSDRIMSRYGDTPLGMVESALEFLRICEDLGYYDIVLSMKSSNPLVMVEAYRLLVSKLDEEGLQPYPLHLGVTEAGEAEDGRIKSAVGIGTLLEDGLGDTVRVSLTEDPEAEAPVAKMLIDRLIGREHHLSIPSIGQYAINPFQYARRLTQEVANFGKDNVPRVIADFSSKGHLTVKDLKEVGHFYLPELDKWGMNDLGVDYLYSGKNVVDFMLPNGLKEIVDYEAWDVLIERENRFPLLGSEQMDLVQKLDQVSFLKLTVTELNQHIETVKAFDQVVIWITTDNLHAMPALRQAVNLLVINDISLPVIIERTYAVSEADQLMLDAATDVGGLLIDGFGDGVMIRDSSSSDQSHMKLMNETIFGILQAARTRITKTEYISCPSCGRTLFDLQETTAMIRKRTDHLKGIKIGIMGCIVNGPGEMADADYGYVGSGKGKITLYKGKEVMKKSVPSAHALDELIELIREDGNWVEPEMARAL